MSSCLECGNIVLLGALCERCRQDNHRECKRQTNEVLNRKPYVFQKIKDDVARVKKYAAKLIEIERLAVEVKLCISEDRGEPNLEMARRRISQIIKESQLGE